MARNARRWRPSRRLLSIAVVVALSAAGALTWTLRPGSGPSYRTARAEIASVEQSLTAVGTVISADRITAAFPVTGTVASVAVAVGERVRAGQTLALLDTGVLQQQVDGAMVTLSGAQQKLATDTSGQAAAAAGTTVTTDSLPTEPLTPATAPSRTRSAGTRPPAASPSGSLATLQQAVLSAQHDLDAALTGLDLTGCAAAPITVAVTGLVATGDSVTVALAVPAGSTAALLDSAGAVVLSGGQALAPQPRSTFTFSHVDTVAYPGPYSVRVTLPAGADLDGVCAGGALTRLQGAIDAKQKTLDAAIAALTHALEAVAGSTASTGAGEASGGTRPASGAGASTRAPSPAGGGSSTRGATGTTTPASAADLAADQAHVDAAQSDLDLARQNLEAGTLTSPIAGQVAAVALSSGQRVTAASQSATITVIGSGATLVSTTVPLSRIDDVAVGQAVQVRVDGETMPLDGTVSRIGVLSTTTGSATTYPVTVELTVHGARLYDGTEAVVTITTRTSTQVLTVPTSAVHALGDRHAVEVLDGGTPRTVLVGIGAMGPQRTQITSGMTAGTRVVLARVDEALPSNSTTNGRRFGGGLGRTGLTGAGTGGSLGGSGRSAGGG